MEKRSCTTPMTVSAHDGHTGKSPQQLHSARNALTLCEEPARRRRSCTELSLSDDRSTTKTANGSGAERRNRLQQARLTALLLLQQRLTQGSHHATATPHDQKTKYCEYSSTDEKSDPRRAPTADQKSEAGSPENPPFTRQLTNTQHQTVRRQRNSGTGNHQHRPANELYTISAAESPSDTAQTRAPHMEERGSAFTVHDWRARSSGTGRASHAENHQRSSSLPRSEPPTSRAIFNASIRCPPPGQRVLLQTVQRRHKLTRRTVITREMGEGITQLFRDHGTRAESAPPVATNPHESPNAGGPPHPATTAKYGHPPREHDDSQSREAPAKPPNQAQQTQRQKLKASAAETDALHTASDATHMNVRGVSERIPPLRNATTSAGSLLASAACRYQESRKGKSGRRPTPKSGSETEALLTRLAAASTCSGR